MALETGCVAVGMKGRGGWDEPRCTVLYIDKPLREHGLLQAIARVNRLFEGKDFGSIYGALTLAGLAGGAGGAWLTGVIHDQTGSYTLAFWIGVGVALIATLSIWMAGPRKVRAVAGQMHRLQARTGS